MDLDKQGCDVVILLTACINPNGMIFTEINDIEIRLCQYMAALDYYLCKTELKIVFCENTGYDIAHNYISYVQNGRLEVISFVGNDYNRSLGKGYGEALIVEKAFQCSKFIKIARYIIKITGRIIISNINQILHTLSLKSVDNLYSSVYSPAKIAYSVFFISNKEFFNDFLYRKEEINDSQGVYFEHILYEVIRDWIAKGGHFSVFLLPVKYNGVSGSTGQVYKKETYIKCLLRYFLFKTLGYGKIS